MHQTHNFRHFLLQHENYRQQQLIRILKTKFLSLVQRILINIPSHFLLQHENYRLQQLIRVQKLKCLSLVERIWIDIPSHFLLQHENYRLQQLIRVQNLKCRSLVIRIWIDIPSHRTRAAHIHMWKRGRKGIIDVSSEPSLTVLRRSLTRRCRGAYNATECVRLGANVILMTTDTCQVRSSAECEPSRRYSDSC